MTNKFNLDLDDELDVRSIQEEVLPILEEDILLDTTEELRFKATDIVLPIPFIDEAGESKIELCTLEEVNKEQFLLWVKAVFPLNMEEINEFFKKSIGKKKDTISMAVKTTIFNMIVALHENKYLFRAGKSIVNEETRKN